MDDKGSGGTQAVHLLLPPNHPPILPWRHPRIRPRHQDTKLTLMSHNRNSATRAAAAPLNSLRRCYFWGLCSVSALLVALPSKQDCFVMQSKLRP